MTVRVHKNYVEQMKSICRRWESLTGLELEDVMYSAKVKKESLEFIENI